MTLDLSGNRALITGSTSGIGKAIALGLARAGAAVVIHGRTSDRVERTVAEIERLVSRSDVGGLVADVGTAEGCTTVLDQEPALDILVNNVGMFRPGTVIGASDRDWHDSFELNVMSGVRLCRHHAPAMAKRSWGRIVFVSSMSALEVNRASLTYSASKSAQLTVARGIAEEVAGSGVTVNSVLPGPTATTALARPLEEIHTRHAVSPDEAGRILVQERWPTSLIGRLISADEVASMVVYLCSPEAAAITGAAVRVDGGIIRAVGH